MTTAQADIKNMLRTALQEQHPGKIASVFRLPIIAPAPVAPEPSPATTISLKVKDVDYTSVLKHWIDACQYARTGYVVKCYESQAALHVAFNQALAETTGNWLIPALHAICANTHRAAIHTDKLDNAATILQESFSRTYNDRKEYDPDASFDEEGSKKAGVLKIVNELFAIYFKLNTLRLCKNLVRPVQTKRLHEGGPLGQKVTYRYFVGRLCLFEDQYEDAEENLEYALRYCHKDATRNKQSILRYLVPIKLFRGKIPTSELLTKYYLHEFIPIVESLQTGNFRQFNDSLIRFQNLFIRQGTYLLLEKCKMLCYRSLFKRIHFILEKHQVPLHYVSHAFKWLRAPMDLDEIECILANLIYRGYIRGYIAHTKRILVLSKREPFPKLSK